MKKSKRAGLNGERIWSRRQRKIWYGISPYNRQGETSDTCVILGTLLLEDFLAEHRSRRMPGGCYAVSRWVPRFGIDLSDWGTLTVRGPGSWVLRSRDGKQMWASGRCGTVICLRAEGSER